MSRWNTHEEEMAELYRMLAQMGALAVRSDPVLLPVIVDESRLKAVEKCVDDHSGQLRSLTAPKTFWQRLRGK